MNFVAVKKSGTSAVKSVARSVITVATHAVTVAKKTARKSASMGVKKTVMVNG